MESIKVKIAGAIAEVTNAPVLTSGMVGLTVEFTFDDSWNNLVKHASFRAGRTGRTKMEIVGNAEVPFEVLENPHHELKIGVKGINAEGTVVIPTVWASAGIIHPGAIPGKEEGADPTLPVWEQVLRKINSVDQQIKDSLKEAKDSGMFDGPQGEKGDTGDVGPQGHQGEKGEAGYTPIKGIDYFDGEKGETGDTGPQGPQGERGVQGEIGPQGPQGEQGIKGEQGPKGETGDVGPQGPEGPQGPQGIQGEVGPQGPRGEQGPQGEKGDTGDIGPQGPQGEKGDTGATGPQGIQGEQGPKGDTGPQGIQGEQGPAGANGADGYTPVKGTDYYTEEDKTEMVNLVLAALPDGDEVSY